MNNDMKNSVSEDRDETFVVAIGRDRMGAGDDELGKMLMKSYIYALRELKARPTELLLFNSGIFLACEGAVTLEDLKAMQQEGLSIQVCGTCLNYFEQTEKLAVGCASNMNAIATAMAEATRLVNL